MSQKPLAVALLVVDAFEALGLEYHVGGSFASSVHGVPRQTRDIDLVVDLAVRHIPGLVLQLREAFYIDPEMLRSAIQRQASCNLIHLDSGFKIDLFIRGQEAFDRQEFLRHSPVALEPGTTRQIMVKSAEDTLLRKLEWYRIGNMVSDRQWNDILGIVRTQGARLDRVYLQEWAEELGVEELLTAALDSTTAGGPE